MKTKTKKTNSSKRGQNYPAYYLAVVLGAVLLLEGFLLGAAAPGSWEKGLEILDISSDVKIVVSDVMEVTQPMWDQYHHIDTFYQLAASEMIVMLDVVDEDTFVFFRGVSEFYRLASIEMEQMLDLSDQFISIGQVAGASISR